jgi:Tol biopolymer transport system component
LLGISVLWIGATGTQAPGAQGGDDDQKESDEKEGLPLEPTRTIELQTDEATWLSLDVSPDGTAIILELLGDLYTVPMAGGEAKRITEGLPFDSQPAYSPDGKSIAFLSDRSGAENLWIAKADASEPVQLSKDEKAVFASPAWTPDGQYVIVSRTTWGLGTNELWMYHVKGGSGVQITKAKGPNDTGRPSRHNALGVVESPDERYLYYARRIGGFSYNATFPMWQIARRDLLTGDEDVLTEAPGSAFRPLLSPDGLTMVYATRFDTQTGLRARSLVTGEDRWLIYPVQRDDQEALFTRDLLPGYSFTPNGKEIVVTFGGKIQRVDVATGDAHEIPFTAAISQKLGPRLHFPRRVEQGPVRARLIQSPRQSPDGRRLAFSGLTRLYVVDLPGGTPRRVTSVDARAFQPTWSPDGRWLAYVTWTPAGGDLWKVPADGSSSPVRLSESSAFYADPAWSPDGERIVVLRGNAYERLERMFDFGETPGMEVVWIPASGGESHLVMPTRGVGRPHFTTDPDRIFLSLSGSPFNSEGPSGLVSVKWDGTDRRSYLQVTGPGLYFTDDPVPADEIQISRDGEWAMVHVSNQLYLVAVPRVGGAAPTVNIGTPTVPIKKLTEVGADYFGWSEDGKSMTWAVGSTFFRQSLDTVTFEEPEKDKDGGKKGKKGSAKDKKKEDKPAEKKPDPFERFDVVLEVPRDTPKGTVVLRGATVITMKGDEVIPNADVVVTDNRIVAVAATGGKVPSGAKIIDVGGKTIVPGFVDTHAHWFEIRRGVMDAENWSFLANLAYGVTAGLDVQTSTNDMFAYQDLVDAGEILGLRAYSTGPGIFSDNDFKSLDEVKGVITRYKEHYRTRNLKSYIVGNRKQREWMVQAAHELEMMPTTEGGLDLKLDLTHVLDGFSGNEHSFPIVPLYRDVVELVARSGIGYAPTLLVNYGGPFAENAFYTKEEVHDDAKLNRFVPHSVIDAKSRRVAWFRDDEYAYPKTAAQAAKILRGGGWVGVGSHGQLQGLGYHWEMWALASGGMTPLEMLRCATVNGAEIIGLSEDIGSIEPGKLADLVVLGSNPLDDVRNTNTVKLVMKNGELFDGDTLDQVWPIARPLPRPWWRDEGPPTSGSR